MTIRTYRPGDETAQVAIYNQATASLPKHKAAAVEEVQRRCRAADFDPRTRFYAEENGQIVAYANYQSNGRVGYPWCQKGHEAAGPELFQHMLAAMKERGLRSAFAAYRGDWPEQLAFFVRQGFRQSREVINFILDLVDMPTSASKPSIPMSALEPSDIPEILKLGAGVLRLTTPDALENYFFKNPYFTADSVFVLRHRPGGQAQAIGILIANPGYANPAQVDAAMPCFRLGAFGTEGMTTKRLNGLFSVLGRSDRDVTPLALELMTQAVERLHDTQVESLAAQAPSDALHLVKFYQRLFRRQGSFPILERTLD